VRLVEMRPLHRSPAHHSGEFAELVCSNSFGALSSDRAAGLLQEELRRLGSLVIATADAHAVPAGGALAVDRGRYSAALTARLEAPPGNGGAPRTNPTAGGGSNRCAGHRPAHQ
jgi:methylenetetrahydrofolate--tRNA-(uracil-5-)-methyltransferase